MSLRGKTWPWVISVVLHAVVLTLIGLWAFDYYENRAAPGGAAAAGAATANTPEPTAMDANAAWQHQRRRIADMSGREKVDELKSRLGDLDAIPFASVRGAAEFVEGIQGVKQDRWYRPNPKAKGKFEPASATLYDIARREKNGRTVYLYTLVDAEGRTTTAEIPDSRIRRNDLWAFEVFEMSRRNPKLRHLVDTALRIGETMLREDSREQGAGSGKK